MKIISVIHSDQDLVTVTFNAEDPENTEAAVEMTKNGYKNFIHHGSEKSYFRHILKKVLGL